MDFMPQQDAQNTSQRDFNRRGTVTTDRPSSSRLGLLLSTSILLGLAVSGVVALMMFLK